MWNLVFVAWCFHGEIWSAFRYDPIRCKSLMSHLCAPISGRMLCRCGRKLGVVKSVCIQITCHYDLAACCFGWWGCMTSCAVAWQSWHLWRSELSVKWQLGILISSCNVLASDDNLGVAHIIDTLRPIFRSVSLWAIKLELKTRVS